MQQRELQKISCRELSEKIQGIKKSIGRREKWLFPNRYGGINQSTITERESERERAQGVLWQKDGPHNSGPAQVQTKRSVV